MLGAFMSGLASGAETMLKLRKEANDLQTQIESSGKLREATKEAEAIRTGAPYTERGSEKDFTPSFLAGSDGTIPRDQDFAIPTTGSGGGTGDPSATGVGDTSATGVGHSVPISERLAYYEQRAKELGLNYNAIAATVHGEGLHQFHGDKGQSFGDFQLYTAGGMGNEAEQAGVNIRDPNHWKEAADFALGQMAQHKGDPSWYAGQWHGAPRWASQNFSDPNAAAPPGWSVPTYLAKPSTPSTVAGPTTTASTGGYDPLTGNPVQALASPAAPALAGPAVGGSGQPTPSQKQQYDADIAAGRRPALPPSQRFNLRGEAISSNLQPAAPGAFIPAGPGSIPGGPLTAQEEAAWLNSLDTGGPGLTRAEWAAKNRAPRPSAALDDTTTQWGALA